MGEIANAQITFDNGPLYIRVDSYGAIRFFTLTGADTVQHINRISLIAAGNQGEVMEYWNDLDIEVETELVASPTSSDYEITGAYNNAFSGASPNYLFEQSVYGWNNASYIVVKCVITNRESADQPTQPGLDVVQYVDYTWEDDKIFYDVTNNVLTQFDIHHVGIKILSEQTTSGQVFKWFDGYEVLDTLYYSMMNAGTFTTDTLVTDADGGVGILGGEHTILTPNATKTIYFGVAVGANGTEMLANMQLAQEKYNQLTSVESDYNNIPSDYLLNQNYPNPFNPSTKISFGLPQRSNVVLKVFNALGEQVAELVNGSLEAGTHTYNFDASDLTSGIYIYSLQTDAGIISNKMTLIK
jgi:hypothetical protein